MNSLFTNNNNKIKWFKNAGKEALAELRMKSKDCVVSENIHTPPTEGIENSWEEGGNKDPKL